MFSISFEELASALTEVRDFKSKIPLIREGDAESVAQFRRFFPVGMEVTRENVFLLACIDGLPGLSIVEHIIKGTVADDLYQAACKRIANRLLDTEPVDFTRSLPDNDDRDVILRAWRRASEINKARGFLAWYERVCAICDAVSAADAIEARKNEVA